MWKKKFKQMNNQKSVIVDDATIDEKKDYSRNNID